MSAIIDRGVVSPLDEVVEVPTGRFEGQEEHMHDLKGRTLRGGQISGDHHSMVGDENIARLAPQINSVLDRLRANITLGWLGLMPERTLSAPLGNRGLMKSFRRPNTRSFTLLSLSERTVSLIDEAGPRFLRSL
jgi:hypothetical protein